MNGGAKITRQAADKFLNAAAFFCRVLFALCCALPPSVVGAIWKYAVFGARFGLVPVLLRAAGFRRIPSFTEITRSGLLQLCYPAFLLSLCGFFLLVLSLRAKHRLTRKFSFAALAVFAAVSLASVLLVLRFSFASTRDIFALRLFSPPNLRGYAAAFGRYGMGSALLNSLLYAFFSSLCAVVLFVPAQKIFCRITSRALILLCFLCAFGIPLFLLVFPSVLRSLFIVPFFTRLTNTRTGRTLIYALLFVPPPLFAAARLNAGGTPASAKSDKCVPADRLPIKRILAPAVFIAVWNDFLVAAAFAPSAKLQPITQALFELAKKLRYAGSWPELFASLVLASLPALTAAAVFICNWRNYEKQRDL